jgi:MerR family transcriptional regulator/heat shock protein HspR
MEVSREHPIYTISVVAQLLNLHEQTIRQYERLGLICPCRTLKKTRLYSQEDVERLECIVYLVKPAESIFRACRSSLPCRPSIPK